MNKTQYRQKFKEIRNLAKQQYDDIMRDIIVEKLKSVVDLSPNIKIGCYYPIHSECDTMPIIEYCWQENIDIALPCIIGKDKPLIFLKWQQNTQLTDHEFQTKIPAHDGHHNPTIEILPDILIVPLLAFNAQCYRLGYGGGFYDRTIQNLKKQKKIKMIGIAFQQQYEENLTIEAHDLPCDVIITQEKIYQK